MVSYEDEVYIGNMLKYIQLLIEKEQKKEYEIIGSVKKGQYDPKLTKRIFWLASKVPC